MKKSLIPIICALSNLTVVAQGLVVFNNNPSTLVTAGFVLSNSPISGAAGSWYFALLTSSSGLPGTFAFTGNYATNSATAPGRFIGGTQVVNGWAPGTTMFYEVAGWSGSLMGHTFQPGWLNYNVSTEAFFGVSSSASGVAGGGSPPVPPFPLFGGTGINQGFLVNSTSIPEPSSMALVGLASAMLLVSRLSSRRRRTPSRWRSLTPINGDEQPPRLCARRQLGDGGGAFRATFWIGGCRSFQSFD